MTDTEIFPSDIKIRSTHYAYKTCSAGDMFKTVCVEYEDTLGEFYGKTRNESYEACKKAVESEMCWMFYKELGRVRTPKNNNSSIRP